MAGNRWEKSSRTGTAGAGSSWGKAQRKSSGQGRGYWGNDKRCCLQALQSGMGRKNGSLRTPLASLEPQHVQRRMPQTFSHFQGHSPALSPCFQTVPELCSSHPVLLPVSGTFDSCSVSFFCQGALLSLLGLDKPEGKRVTGSSGRTGALFHPPVRDLKLASARPKHCTLWQQEPGACHSSLRRGLRQLQVLPRPGDVSFHPTPRR